MFGAVASFTYKPPFVAPEPFNSMILSPICTVVESTIVWVPETVKLPLIVTFWPSSEIADFNEDEYVFNSATEVFKLAVVEFKLAVAEFKFVIETSCESFVVFAVDADVINEPVIVANAVFWVNWEPLKEFKFVIETSCESFVVLAVDADVIKLPLTTPISVSRVSTEPV